MLASYRVLRFAATALRLDASSCFAGNSENRRGTSLGAGAIRCSNVSAHRPLGNPSERSQRRRNGTAATALVEFLRTAPRKNVRRHFVQFQTERRPERAHRIAR